MCLDLDFQLGLRFRPLKIILWVSVRFWILFLRKLPQLTRSIKMLTPPPTYRSTNKQCAELRLTFIQIPFRFRYPDNIPWCINNVEFTQTTRSLTMTPVWQWPKHFLHCNSQKFNWQYHQVYNWVTKLNYHCWINAYRETHLKKTKKESNLIVHWASTALFPAKLFHCQASA